MAWGEILIIDAHANSTEIVGFSGEKIAGGRRENSIKKSPATAVVKTGRAEKSGKSPEKALVLVRYENRSP